MSRIRGSGNKATEAALARIFRKHGITGWRRNQKIFGRPDFVFRKAKIAIFVDGCFWHSCPIHSIIPHGNNIFWVNKLELNKKRDVLVNKTLKQMGWRVIRIWEHDLNTIKGRYKIDTILHLLREQLQVVD